MKIFSESLGHSDILIDTHFRFLFPQHWCYDVIMEVVSNSREPTVIWLSTRNGRKKNSAQKTLVTQISVCEFGKHFLTNSPAEMESLTSERKGRPLSEEFKRGSFLIPCENILCRKYMGDFRSEEEKRFTADGSH